MSGPDPPAIRRSDRGAGMGGVAWTRFAAKSSPPMSEPDRPGILPCQAIDALIANGAIASATPFEDDQVQPASLDLRLGERAWRVRASFLPGRHTVRERIAEVAMHEVDLTRSAVLERGCVYIAPPPARL